MKIISNYRDYYDGLQGFGGFDDDLIYRRQCDFKSESYIKFDFGNIKPTFLVGFCGKLYQARYYQSNFHYDIDSYVAAHASGLAKKEKEYFFNPTKTNRRSLPKYSRFFNPYQNVKDLKESWRKTEERLSEREKGLGSSLDKYATFVCYYSKFGYKALGYDKDRYILPYYSLEKLQFFKVFDPYQTYQELFMWLGNKAAPEKYVPEMSDTIKIGQHGFDKFSFRKDKK